MGWAYRTFDGFGELFNEDETVIGLPFLLSFVEAEGLESEFLPLTTDQLRQWTQQAFIGPPGCTAIAWDEDLAGKDKLEALVRLLDRAIDYLDQQTGQVPRAWIERREHWPVARSAGWEATRVREAVAALRTFFTRPRDQ